MKNKHIKSFEATIDSTKPLNYDEKQEQRLSLKLDSGEMTYEDLEDKYYSWLNEKETQLTGSMYGWDDVAMLLLHLYIEDPKKAKVDFGEYDIKNLSPGGSYYTRLVEASK